MTTAPAIRVWDTPPASLGEGPVWSVREGALYWTDIFGRRLHRLDPASGEVTSWAMPERLCAFGMRASGGWIGAFESGFAFFDLDDPSPEWIVRPYEPGAGIRFNDGKTSPEGRFLSGSMVERGDAARGELWSVSPDGGSTIVLAGIRISNSLAWSPDGRTVYFADSPEERIVRYPYDPETGAFGPGETHADLADPPGVPDGSATDRDGGLWTAMFGGSSVIRTLPSGTVDRVVDLPALQPTSCAFGGADLGTLFVTTATVGMAADALEAHPASGRILSFDAGVPGTPPSTFAG